MQGVFSAPIAEFLKFETVRVVAAALLAGIVTLLAFGASEVNHHANFFLCHDSILKRRKPAASAGLTAVYATLNTVGVV
jgi:hypothetical protein